LEVRLEVLRERTGPVVEPLRDVQGPSWRNTALRHPIIRNLAVVYPENLLPRLRIRAIELPCRTRFRGGFDDAARGEEPHAPQPRGRTGRRRPLDEIASGQFSTGPGVFGLLLLQPLAAP